MDLTAKKLQRSQVKNHELSDKCPQCETFWVKHTLLDVDDGVFELICENSHKFWWYAFDGVLSDWPQVMKRLEIT